MEINFTLTFQGAAGSTTGSRHLLQVDDKLILLDCGLYQGRREETTRQNKQFRFNPAALHSVLLSHAHIDHSGNLPNLVKQGFGGTIHTTTATRDLCQVMLLDSAHIQEHDAEWLNRRNRKRGRGEIIEPLYTMDDANEAMGHFQSVGYHHPFHVLQDVKVTFYDAGHILGSSSVIIDLRRGEEVFRLAYTGDLGRANLPLLRDPEIPHNVDWLVLESTYGSRIHDPIGEAKEELRETITRVAARGGKIIVPSFSVERTQEVIYYLNELTNEGRLPPIPVFVDSPLAINVTEIFRLHADCFDRETRRLLLEDGDPFGFSRLSYVRDVEESKRLNSLVGPCMIISASGMCEAGRIRHHLANSIEDPKNCIMFVGYQAENTLGRKIVERQPEVNIFGEPYRLRAEVVTLNTMSGHADQNDLAAYARVVRDNSPRLKKVFLVHGEEESRTALAARLRADLGLKAVIPQLGERHLLDGKDQRDPS
ncbi:MAG: MBL fold metallo-hydrolase [bacterium]|nr:MBL fold metallo-hydrolase [bacterium]